MAERLISRSPLPRGVLPASRNEFSILVYHRIGGLTHPRGYSVASSEFVRQMSYLQSICTPLSLSAILTAVQNHKPLPRCPVAVTFDDGYADTLRVAAPILKRFRIPATVFVTTGYIDRQRAGFRRVPMLTWRDLRELPQWGFDIGSHTVTHPNLRQCTSQKIRNELKGSRQRLEDQLGMAVPWFAYPFGTPLHFDERVRACVVEAGYQAACTFVSGMNGLRQDPWTLHRHLPVPDPLGDFSVELLAYARRELKKENEKKIFGLGPAARRALQHLSRDLTHGKK